MCAGPTTGVGLASSTTTTAATGPRAARSSGGSGPRTGITTVTSAREKGLPVEQGVEEATVEQAAHELGGGGAFGERLTVEGLTGDLGPGVGEAHDPQR